MSSTKDSDNKNSNSTTTAAAKTKDNAANNNCHPISYIESPRGRQLIHNKYLFARDRINKNKTYWRCTVQGCQARLTIVDDGVPEVVGKGKKQHNHAPDGIRVAKKIFKQAMRKQICQNPSKSIPKVYNEVMAEVTSIPNPLIDLETTTSAITLNSIRSALYRTKRRTRKSSQFPAPNINHNEKFDDMGFNEHGLDEMVSCLLGTENKEDLPDRSFITDFEQVVRDYVQRVGKEYNRTVEWWDIHGRHSYIAERPKYNKYKLAITSDNLIYGPASQTLDRPGYDYSQWFHNSSSDQTTKQRFTKQIERPCKFTWTVTKGLRIGTSVNVFAGVPGEFGASFSLNLKFNLEQHTRTTTETEIFSVTNLVHVRPNTSVKAECSVVEREMNIPWQVNVYIDGYVALWFKEKYNGHHLWFHPVYKLATGSFMRQNNGLVYVAEGHFNGVRGLECILQTYDYPLQSIGGFNSNLIPPYNATVLERGQVQVDIHGTDGD